MITYSLQNVKIDPVAFDYVFNEPEGDVGRWMARRGKVATNYATRRAGRRTGHLRAAISMRHDRKAPGRRQQVRIGTFSPGRGYALLHHEGTRPHIIASKRGRFMTFSIKGKRVTARVVKHPGTKPNHYLTDTFKMFIG